MSSWGDLAAAEEELRQREQAALSAELGPDELRALATERDKLAGSSTSPGTGSTGRLYRARVRSGRRASTATSCPRRDSALTRCVPTKPVPPVTSIFRRVRRSSDCLS